MPQRLLNNRRLPPLARSHPTFFIILAIVAFHHAWLFVTQLWQPWRYEGAGLYEVYRAADREVWAVGALIAFVLITVGVYTRWRIVQLGLAVGLVLSVLRTWLIELGPNPGAGVGVWLVVIGSHFVQMLEPPRNPLTERM